MTRCVVKDSTCWHRYRSRPRFYQPNYKSYNRRIEHAENIISVSGFSKTVWKCTSCWICLLLTICVLNYSLAAPFVNRASQTFKAAKERLSPVIRERLLSMNEGDYDQKANSVRSVRSIAVPRLITILGGHSTTSDKWNASQRSRPRYHDSKCSGHRIRIHPYHI